MPPQSPLFVADNMFNDSVEFTSRRWPAHLAKNMADSIHQDVVDTLSQSRLVPVTDGIQLVQRSDIAKVEELLGSGAFSQVSSVTTRDGRRYACKHLKQKLMSQPKDFRSAAVELVYEAHMLASFDHPHILKIRGWSYNGVASFEEGRNDSFFLLLDLLDETLDMRIERWQCDQQQTAWPLLGSSATAAQSQYLEKLQCMIEIISALEYIHQRGVIFRDLKPNNIGFLGNQVKMFDFGLSRELPMIDPSAHFEMSGKVGTLRYMAPEVATRMPYGMSADIYSFAMVSYEILSLEKPFNGWTRDMHANLVCIQGHRPDLAACCQPIPIDMRIILEHTWHANPSCRPSLSQISTQLELIIEKQAQLLILQEQQFQMQLSVQQHNQQQALAIPAVFDAMCVNMNYCRAAGAPTKQQERRYCLDDSIGTIETASLSADSQDFFFQ